ncbi:hypothetical protein AB0A05_34825 [Streptomyces sp. NPDC046374]|uniref:hypothetical protein n=1 Tax=Streptomyces sp. NPDC046374 TaxID=3154917 RepID=UPI0034100152
MAIVALRMGRSPVRTKAVKGSALAGVAVLLSMVLGCSAHETNNNCSGSSQCGNGNGRNEEAKPTASLELAMVTAELRDGISVENRDAFDEAPPEKGKGRGVHIDITAKNLGKAPAFISKATMTFRKSGYLEPCYAIGGQLLTTAVYGFTIPDTQPSEPVADGRPRLHRVPFSVSKELTHEIPPNKYEKFTLTVGPETIVEGGNPWFGVLDITLEHDGGQKLKIGPIAVVDTGGNPAFFPDWRKGEPPWYIEKETAPGCTKRNADFVSELMKTSKLVPSKEFSSLNDALAKYR